MELRVTFCSPSPIPKDLVALCGATRVSASEASFGHLVHAMTLHDDPEALREQLRQAAGEVTVAVVDGPLARRDAQLILSDVDATFTMTESIDLLAAQVGKGAEVAAITEAAMRGQLDFEESLRRRVATLKGLPASVFDEIYPMMTLTPGARELVTAAHSHGARIGVTSGGFTQLVGRLADDYGLDFFHANELETTWRDGTELLTGGIIGHVVDRAQKSQDLIAAAERFNVPLTQTVAVGDGANDLTMLATAALGVAFCAKPVTAAQADAHVAFLRLDAVAALAFPADSLKGALV